MLVKRKKKCTRGSRSVHLEPRLLSSLLWRKKDRTRARDDVSRAPSVVVIVVEDKKNLGAQDALSQAPSLVVIVVVAVWCCGGGAGCSHIVVLCI